MKNYTPMKGLENR